jgi:glucose-1-phosphate thymidylyltransferase
MKAIILAAGFATRLYPITENKAKPLLEIKGKPIIDYIVEKIKELPIDEIIVITNNKFYNDFLAWKDKKAEEETKNIKILNDGVNSEQEKLGSIGDLLFTIDKEKINEDLLVISGDNLFECSLKEAYDLFKKENKDLSIFYDIQKIEEAKRFGVALVENNLIIDFQEKPSQPKSTLCSASTYFYKKETLNLIKEFTKEENKDYPGLLMQYLYKKVPIYAYIVEKWLDIGTEQALEQASTF